MHNLRGRVCSTREDHGDQGRPRKFPDATCHSCKLVSRTGLTNEQAHKKMESLQLAGRYAGTTVFFASLSFHEKTPLQLGKVTEVY